MGKGRNWPLAWKIELFELINCSAEGKITSRIAWEFKTVHPELSEQSILSMGRRLLKYKDADELRTGEEGTRRAAQWSKAEEEEIILATRKIGLNEKLLTPIFSELAKKFNRPPTAVRRRWIHLLTRNRIFSTKNKDMKKDMNDDEILRQLSNCMSQIKSLKKENKRILLALKQVEELVDFTIFNNSSNRKEFKTSKSNGESNYYKKI